MRNNFTWDYTNSYEWMKHAQNHNPLIITVAINGGVQGKEMHSTLPETPDEIAEEVYKAYNAGASIVHVHGRDPDCLYSCAESPDIYLEINKKIREKCPKIIINNTTGGGLESTMESRIKNLDAQPELASLNMGPDMTRVELPPRKAPLKHPHDGLKIDGCIPFTYGIIEKLAETMQKKDIKPEMEIYHPGQYWVSRELIKKGLIKPPYIFQFVMGYQTSSFPTPKNLINLLDEIPENSLFSVIGIGKYQWALTTLGIIIGGNVRVGLEDNLYRKYGEKLKDNADAVNKVVRIARELNREVASPAKAREILGISQVPRTY